MIETPVSVMDDEIDLLDLLVTVAESWKLLVIAPVLIAIATFTGATFLKPTFYQSSAVVSLTEDQLGFLHSASILDPLAESFGYLGDAEGDLEDAREALKKDLISSVDKRTKLVTITTKATSAEQAQKLNEQAISRLLAELTPKGQDKAYILNQIEVRKQAIFLAETAFEKLVQTFPKGSVGAANVDQAVSNIASLVTLVLDNKKAIQDLEQQLLVKGSEIFIQTPTLARKPLPHNRAMVAVIAALASGFALLLVVFIRKALINAGSNPESAKKIAQIKQSFGISSKAT